ncbi:MAG: NAD(P)-binding domain-containing protein [Saprospiraceae bacterium]|nr:NAD(P)-binding domain-containing protein [Saprospiraceae bacterium]
MKEISDNTNEPFLRKDTIVVGGGQAGLATGYHLTRHNIDFAILDARQRTGDSWRERWDSLRVFTPARYCSLPGMPFPGPDSRCPYKDEVADYLETYAQHLELPLYHNMRIDKLSRVDDHFVLKSGRKRIEANNVIVAMSGYQHSVKPDFAKKLRPEIRQIHSGVYKNPSQYRPGGVLVVGASDSGCEIAMEAVATHETWLSGRHPGHVPFAIDGMFGKLIGVRLVIGLAFHHFLSLDTPVGRRVRPKLVGSTGPNVRLHPKHIRKAGIQRIPKIINVDDGLPVPEGCGPMDVQNVVWCTGFRPNFEWIDIESVKNRKHPKDPPHQSGIMTDEAGLYFVGLFFTHALSSSLLRGVSRDAKRVVNHLVEYR